MVNRISEHLKHLESVPPPLSQEDGPLEHLAWWLMLAPVLFVLALLCLFAAAVSGAPAPLPRPNPITTKDIVGVWDHNCSGFDENDVHCPGMLTLNVGQTSVNVWNGRTWVGKWELIGDVVWLDEWCVGTRSNWGFTVKRDKSSRLVSDVQDLRKR